MRIVALLVMLSAVICPLVGQVATARLEGTVHDASGAVIPNARLSLVNNRTDSRLEAITGAEGFFVFAALQPGFFTLSVDANGFRPATVSNIELNVGDTVSELVKLELGPIAESITVDANAVRVQTTEATMSRTVTMRDLDVLPQLSRTPVYLANLQPGVAISSIGPSFSVVNGNRPGSNNVMLDGVDANDPVAPALGLLVVATNTDSVEEFRMITSGAKAEYGRNAGGQIELVTRSGTNTYHGNLFEYHRNTVLNANTFFNNSTGTPRPKFLQNIFGASLGGVVSIPGLYKGQERTFFFLNYQGQRTAQELSVNRLVPTALARQGIFQWMTPESRQVRSFDIFANDPRRIGIDRQVASMLTLMPLPNNFDDGDRLNTGGFRFNAAAPTREDQWTAKFDHNVSRSHRLYYRISGRGSQNSFNTSLVPTFPGQPGAPLRVPTWGYAAGSNWILTSWVVNEFLIGQQNVDLQQSVPRPSGPVIIASSWSNPLRSGNSLFRSSPVTQITDNISMAHSKHTFKTGVTFRLTTQHVRDESLIYPNVQLSRNPAAVPQGIGPFEASVISPPDRLRFENLYNDLLGRVSQIQMNFNSDLEEFFSPGTPRVRNFNFHEYGYFLQDDWRLSPRLTLNFGLRWEFFGVPRERDRLQGVVQQAERINAANSISDVTIQRGTNWFAADWNNFAPRLGFSWDPAGNGKMAVRGSYGVFYDRVIGQIISDVDSLTPGFTQPNALLPNLAPGTDVRVTADNPTIPSPSGKPLLTPADDRVNRLELWDPRFRTPYVQQFNFTIQRELFRNTVVELAYVASRGVKLLTKVNLNQGKIHDGFLQAFKEIQAFRSNGTAVSPTNTLVRIFGSVNDAVAALGGSTFDTGQAGAAAQALDVGSYANYTAAGISDFYIRSYPQFDFVRLTTNGGRSYYDSMQLGVRQRMGTLRVGGNYTWSKSIDDVSSDGNGFTGPIDNFNLKLNRGRSDFDRPHAVSWMASYTLPIGKGKRIGGSMPDWLDRMVGGWDLGSVGTLISGRTLTVSSGLLTSGNAGLSTWANFNGTSRNIGAVRKQSNGVVLWTPEEIALFSLPGAGEIGSAGRNTFRGPDLRRVDLALAKRFRVNEQCFVTFRAEAYNLFNRANFNDIVLTMGSPTFGRISNILIGPNGGPRVIQGALRLDF